MRKPRRRAVIDRASLDYLHNGLALTVAEAFTPPLSAFGVEAA